MKISSIDIEDLEDGWRLSFEGTFPDGHKAKMVARATKERYGALDRAIQELVGKVERFNKRPIIENWED